MKFLAWIHRARPLQTVVRVLVTVGLVLVVVALASASPILPVHLLTGMVVGGILGMLAVDNAVMGAAMHFNKHSRGTVWDDKHEPVN